MLLRLRLHLLLLWQLLLLLHLRLLRWQLLLRLHLQRLGTERTPRRSAISDNSNALLTAVPLIWVLRLLFTTDVARAQHKRRTILPGHRCPWNERGSFPRGPLPILDLPLLTATGLSGRKRLLLLLLQLRLLLLRLGPLSIHTPVPLAKPCSVLRKVLATHKANLTSLRLPSRQLT